MSSACRFCSTPLTHTFCDLGMSPLSNSYIEPGDANGDEALYPLHARVCSVCYLVQLEEFESPQNIFSDYAYFSSYSDSWLAHCKSYVEQMSSQLCLDGSSSVIEIASNDGYLLQYFVAAGIPVLGIEPAANVAEAATARGIPTLVRFFGVEKPRGNLPSRVSRPICCSATTCSPMYPTSTISSPAWRSF